MKLAVVACILALALALAPPAFAQPAADPLAGVWRYQERSAPVLHGGLALTLHGHVWRAVIGGKQATAEQARSELHLVFPQNLGQHGRT